MSPSTPEFTIIGAGPVGALAALLLAERGSRVRLIERRADPRHEAAARGRSINLALAARGIAALEHARLMGRIAPQLVSMRGRMVHAPDGAQRLLPYGSHPDEAIHAIGREQLNRLLIEAVAEHPRIELQFNARCVDVDPQSATLTVEVRGAQRVLAFRWLLGCDGAHSTVRSALQARGLTRAHEELLAHDYKELSIAPAPGTRDWRFEPHALHLWPRGGFMLIALPNADGSFTATLFLAREGEPGFASLCSAGAVRALFTREFADTLPHLPDLVEQFAQHPQARLGTVHCERWSVGGRVLLLGDAAHAIVPFHGQGLNCGFEDCRLLAGQLAADTDVGAVFTRFEQQRRPDAEAIAAMAIENYLEMREGVRSAQFPLRQQLAAELERSFPGRFIPRYSMVMFHPEIGYAEAQRRGERQQRLLDELASRAGYGPLQAERLTLARELLDAQGL